MDYQLRNSLDSSLYERRIYSNYSYPRHIHRFLEIAYVLEGELQITLDSVVQDVRAGEMALIFPHIIHEYHTVHQSKVAVFIISNSYIPYISSKIDNMEADSYVFKPEIPVRNYFDYSLVDQEKPDPLSIKTAVYAVFQSYFKSHILLPREGANGELLAKVLPYVAKNFREDISLKNLAKEFGYNYHYFSHIFNSTLKIGFGQFLSLYRIDHACLLLRETDMDITAVSMECGFQSIRSFNRVFSQVVNEPPLKYRQRFRK